MKLKSILLILCVTIAIPSFSQANLSIKEPLHELKSTTNLKAIETFHVNVDGVGKTTVTLAMAPDWNDPGDFLSVTLKNEQYNVTFTNSDGWVKIQDGNSIADDLLTQSTVNSKNAIVCHSDKYDYLVLAGYTYASSYGLLTVIDLRKGEIVVNRNIKLMSIDEKGGMTFDFNGLVSLH